MTAIAIESRCPRAMDITVNGTPSFALDTTASDVAELVRSLGLEGKRIAVERNGEIVPKSRYADTPVLARRQAGDRRAVGGG